jgi:transketolase
MRKRSLDMVFELARRDERVVFIGSDLSPGLLGEMKTAYPDRYFMEGIAEANIIGMAAGMAMDGLIPYVNTIATFITRRCYEQVAVDLCLHDLPVRLIGNGGGYVYAPLGPTHQAIEDIAIMRALPNMTVTAVCDADEMSRLMEASLDWPHPIYIRLAKGGDPVISRPERGFAIGKAIEMTAHGGIGMTAHGGIGMTAHGGIGMSAGDGAADVLLVATGVATTQALAASERLANRGLACRVLHMHTVKPLDAEAVVTAAGGVRLVVTVEEHSVVGGLGSAVLEALADAGGPMPRVKRLGIGDRFAEHYGSQAALMGFWGLNAEGIARAVIETIGPAR